MHKEPNGTLVMTTCKCRENNKNLVMTRTYFNEMLQNKIAWGAEQERERIIKLLEDEQWHDMVFAKEVVVNGEVYHGWRKNHSMACNGCKQIALIKGEN